MTTHLNFSSWVQPSASGGLPHDDAQANARQPADPAPLDALTIGVYVNNTLAPLVAPPAPPVNAPATLTMLGPADIVGVDPAQIVRRFPAPGTNDTETTNLACIELATTDLPWRFSPACTTGERLRPWLVLVVVNDADLQWDQATKLPIVRTDQLPDLAQSWAWAHAQLDGDGSPPDPAQGRARLLCPRHLPDDTTMRAMLVPAFRGGMLAGGGNDNKPNTNVPESERVHEPAWRNGDPPVTLPVYDQWTFRTGDGRDFEYLAERLRPARPGDIAGFGSRPVDIGDPFPNPSATTPPAPQVIPVGGALVPVSVAPPTPNDAAAIASALQNCAAALQSAINTVSAIDDAGGTALGPPLRGGPHANQTTIDATKGGWLDQANSDPRWRLAAARGADWVTANQEDLMAQAWQQAGQIRAAAQRLAIARTGQAVTQSLQSRHLAPLTLDETIRVTAPAARRLRVDAANVAASNPSLRAVLDASVAPNGLGSTPFARLARARAGVAANATLTSRALAGDMLSLPGITQHPNSVTRTVLFNREPFNFTLSPNAAHASLPTLTPAELVQFARDAVDQTDKVTVIPQQTATSLWQSAIAPAVAHRARISSLITTAGGADDAVTAHLQPVLPTPRVASPMAMALIDRDPDWLVVGASRFPDDRATLLKPDNEFVESVLLGANDALLNEYLWRGFPTDRRGTPVRQFWPAAASDIDAIDTWARTDTLGSHINSSDTNLTFLMIRSELFQRYPDTVILAVPAVTNSSGAIVPDETVSNWKAPSFRMIAVNARTRIVGFPIQSTVVAASPGYYFVLIEPPTGLRFGFEPWPAQGGGSFLDALSAPFGAGGGSGSDAACVALREQTRVFLHASSMVGGA